MLLGVTCPALSMSSPMSSSLPPWKRRRALWQVRGREGLWTEASLLPKLPLSPVSMLTFTVSAWSCS